MNDIEELTCLEGMTEFDMKYLRYIQERYDLKQSVVQQEMKKMFERLEEIKGREQMSIEDKIKNAKESHLFDELSEKEKFEAILEARLKVRLLAELEKIKAEMDEYKEFQDGHFIDASEMKHALMYIINTRLCKLKGESNGQT